MKKALFLILPVAVVSTVLADNPRKDNKVPHVPLNQQSGWDLGTKTTFKKTKKVSKYNDLKNNLTNANVTKEGNKIKVTFAGGLLFASGSDQLQSKAQRDLATIANLMNKHKKTKVRIEGHTDSQGDAGFNKDLSKKRAKAVASSLESKGIQQKRIKVIGLGESNPVASNDTASGRQANRRVELFITN